MAESTTPYAALVAAVVGGGRAGDGEGAAEGVWRRGRVLAAVVNVDASWPLEFFFGGGRSVVRGEKRPTTMNIMNHTPPR